MAVIQTLPTKVECLATSSSNFSMICHAISLQMYTKLRQNMGVQIFLISTLCQFETEKCGWDFSEFNQGHVGPVTQIDPELIKYCNSPNSHIGPKITLFGKKADELKSNIKLFELISSKENLFRYLFTLVKPKICILYFWKQILFLLHFRNWKRHSDRILNVFADYLLKTSDFIFRQ